MTKSGKRKLIFWIIFSVVMTNFFVFFLQYLLSRIADKPEPTIQVTESENDAGATDQDAAYAAFKESVGKTMDLYDNVKYDVNKNLVSVVIDLDAWNQTSEDGRTDFMNEIYTLIHSDAITSGILEYKDVSVNFMTSDYKNVHPYPDIVKGSGQD